MKVLGIINLMNEKTFLKKLTEQRSLASVPFAGRYRLIDFTLSNYRHAGIKQVAVFTSGKFRSLMDHLGAGKEWDLDRHNGGLFILPSDHPDKNLTADIPAFYNYLEMFRRSPAEFIILSPGYHVGKIDYQAVIQQHENNRADITVLYKHYDGDLIRKPIYHKCRLRENGSVKDIELYSIPHKGDPICLETYVLKKSLFIEMIAQCFQNNEDDFLKDGIKAHLDQLHIQGYSFQGHMPFIHSMESYYASNMEFLNPDMIRAYFYEQWNISTKVKHEAPAKYSATSNVSNSFIANGCEIEGTVENSVLFRGVSVKKGAIVRNSIIMQKGKIAEGAYVENIIADKHARISEKTSLIGEVEPKVIKKSEIV
ncbi:glucose-1-phosphate adenylyltransferase [Lederbergia galactosidilytica]|uniref:Glucose-1-phosphate adenylyltransferase n=1 Tax=Lederbergia galactosidilytica TaxID=217031 RepID=A0A0Q9XZ62_9BACI|nr:glucose-1-phosphate adenylyltransferase [Lederbergia galactosidilytica]